jgi:spermidine/putrescine ABC transporter ATP-binding subunit
VSAPLISLRGVSKRYGRTRAVEDVTLDIEAGAFFALLGPSGCGKTTLLRMLAGFETVGSGAILIEGRDVADVPPNRRPVNMVFQSYAVFPHMSVAANVAYGLRMEGVRGAELARRVDEALALVAMDGMGGRKPDQLSGGQRQRVALARALVKRPRVLLLDEPLSALDAKLRGQMRSELTRLQQAVGITFVMVTHDQDEALALASRCAVMRDGAIQQVGAPADLYERPASRFVADFIGQVNLIEGVVVSDGPAGATLRAEALDIAIHASRSLAVPVGARVWAAIRPETIALHEARGEDPPPAPPDAPAGCNRVCGVVSATTYLGGQSLFEVALACGACVKVTRPNLRQEDRQAFAVGQPVWLTWPACAAALLKS